MTTGNNELLTTADVAAALGLSARHVRKLAKDKKVGRQITRGVWLFTQADIEQLKDRAKSVQVKEVING